MASRVKRRKAGQQASAKRESRHSQALDFIIYKIGILRRLIERYANPAITETYGMTVAEWRVLTHLFSTSPMTATELSRRLWTDKAEVSRACSSLIAKGLIASRPDAGDRRSALLSITRSGEQLHDRILPLRRTLQNELTAELTVVESRTLHRSLDKLIRLLSERLLAGEESAAPARARPGTARRRKSAPVRRRPAQRSRPKS